MTATCGGARLPSAPRLYNVVTMRPDSNGASRRGSIIMPIIIVVGAPRHGRKSAAIRAQCGQLIARRGGVADATRRNLSAALYRKYRRCGYCSRAKAMAENKAAIINNQARNNIIAGHRRGGVSIVLAFLKMGGGAWACAIFVTARNKRNLFARIHRPVQ